MTSDLKNLKVNINNCLNIIENLNVVVKAHPNTELHKVLIRINNLNNQILEKYINKLGHYNTSKNNTNTNSTKKAKRYLFATLSIGFLIVGYIFMIYIYYICFFNDLKRLKKHDDNIVDKNESEFN